VGLIGGSLAWGVKRRELAREVVGVDRDPASLRYAIETGMIDGSAGLEAAVRGADLVVLAVPVGAVAALADELVPWLAPEAVVTDVGSVKLRVVERVGSVIPRFVGGHPMAGGERSGAAAAVPDLFDGTQCFLTPTARTDPKALEVVERLWNGLGATVVRMDAAKHDEVVAAVSHLPHLAAFALVNAVAAADPAGAALAFAAGGFRDMTRIAASSPEMWRDICLMNRDPLLGMLSRYADAVGRLRELVGRGDGQGLLDEFTRAQSARRGLRGGSG
jgi:prephenate dehydrogenase